jgi:hypothetical protein
VEHFLFSLDVVDCTVWIIPDRSTRQACHTDFVLLLEITTAHFARFCTVLTLKVVHVGANVDASPSGGAECYGMSKISQQWQIGESKGDVSVLKRRDGAFVIIKGWRFNATIN